MNLYLVQHGEAEPKDVDPARPLTASGREALERVAAFAQRLGVEVAQIRHSGKTRAEQTATILGEALKPAEGVVAVSGLAPNDDVLPIVDALDRETQPLMLVGHQPFMGRLAGALVRGDPDLPPVLFRMGGIVFLSRPEGRWLVSWAITPEMASAVAR
jgi:phosphohistidine phosphatase